MGLEERLKQQNLQGKFTRTIDIYIASATSTTTSSTSDSSSSSLASKMKIASMLWKNKIRCEYNPTINPKLKYELQYVLEKNIPYMIIIGEDEWKDGKCKVKDIEKREEILVD